MGMSFAIPFRPLRWEFMVQRSPCLRILCIEDVDLGSGPLEWLCKGLRSHKERYAWRLAACNGGGQKAVNAILTEEQ